MSEGLGLVNTKLSVEDNLQVLRDNGIEISKKLLNIGATLIKEKSSHNVQNVTSTSYVPVADFQIGFQSSGSLTAFVFQPWIYANALTIFVQMEIDGTAVKTYSFFQPGPGSVSACFMHLKELNKGNHTLKYSAKVTGGTGIIGDATYDSTLYIVEFNNGG